MKPLSTKKRTGLLISLVLFFILLVPIILGYSSGYRFGDAFSLVKTGGIYLHSDISKAKVFIDDEFVEDNGIILRNTLVQDLKPNHTYKIRVEKDGYQTWQKYIKVFPNLVSEASIMMLKTNPEIRTITKFLEDKSKTADTNSSVSVAGTVNPEYIALELLFSEDKPQFEIEIATTTLISTNPRVATTTLIATTSLPTFIEELEIPEILEKEQLKEKNKNVVWIEDGDIVVVWAGDDNSTPFYFCEVALGYCKNRILISFAEDFKRYDFYPGRSDVLLVLTSKGLFAVEVDDRSEPNIHSVYLGENLDFRLQNGNQIFIKQGNKFLEIL